jgi:hypothetical protein
MPNLNILSHKMSANIVRNKRMTLVKRFYQNSEEIKASHRLDHVMRVYHHAIIAITCHEPHLSSDFCMEIEIASL